MIQLLWSAGGKGASPRRRFGSVGMTFNLQRKMKMAILDQSGVAPDKSVLPHHFKEFIFLLNIGLIK